MQEDFLSSDNENFTPPNPLTTQIRSSHPLFKNDLKDLNQTKKSSKKIELSLFSTPKINRYKNIEEPLNIRKFTIDSTTATPTLKRKRVSLIGNKFKNIVSFLQAKKKINSNNNKYTEGKKNENNFLNVHPLFNKKISKFESSAEFSIDEDFLSEKSIYSKNSDEPLTRKNTLIIKKNEKVFNKTKIKNIKRYFLLNVSISYFSIFLLCIKLINTVKLPEIPSTSTILFIIYFNELVFSLVFMQLDQIDVTKNFNTDDLYHFVIEIILEFFKTLLVVISLQRLPILPFILILHLNPIIISFIILKQKMEYTTKIDRIFYIIIFCVIFYEIILFDELGVLYSTLLLIIISFDASRKYKTAINFHEYFLIFGSGIIGVSVSPLIMSVNSDDFSISTIQYLVIFILSFAHFFFLYFTQKYIKIKSENDGKLMINFILPIIWMYSCFIFHDKYSFSTYFILLLSLCSHVYGRIKIETLENE